MSDLAPTASNLPTVLGEVRKIPAFFRRDLLTMWSYRTAFFTDWINMLVQVVLFGLIGGLVDADRFVGLQRQGGYVAFAAIGIAVASFLQVGVHRLVGAMRREQLMGTLESVLLTPTSPITFQVGSVVYDLAYIPIRTFIFLGLVALVLDVSWSLGAALPAAVVVLAFIPFVWGLGMLGAGMVVALRRGGDAIGFATVLLTILSTSYVPLEVMPDWLRWLIPLNPVTITLDTTRALLAAEAGWGQVWAAVVMLVPIGLASLAVGAMGFHLALRRERRRGSLGLY